MKGFGKINEDGYLMSSQVRHTAQWKPLEEFVLNSKGELYTHYEDVNTPHTPNTVKLIADINNPTVATAYLVNGDTEVIIGEDAYEENIKYWLTQTHSVGTPASEYYQPQIGTPASEDYDDTVEPIIGTPASEDYQPQFGTPASEDYDAEVLNVPDEAFSQEELLSIAKTKKLEEIDTAKNEAQLTPVTVRGVQFFGGREAGQKYDEAFRLAQMMGLLVGNFLSADSGMIEVDEPYATEVVVAVAGATYMLWAKAQEYNAQVNMATTVAEVEAIVWTA